MSLGNCADLFRAGLADAQRERFSQRLTACHEKDEEVSVVHFLIKFPGVIMSSSMLDKDASNLKEVPRDPTRTRFSRGILGT